MDQDRPIIVENFDDLTADGAAKRVVVDEQQPEQGGGTPAILTRKTVHTWVSPNNKDIVVRFRRPPGGTREAVYTLLGPTQSDNEPLVRRFNALASIVSIGTNPGDLAYKIKQPTTVSGYRALAQRVGFVGPDDEDWYDEPVDLFVRAWEIAMNPELLDLFAESQGASADDKTAIMSAIGLQAAKK